MFFPVSFLKFLRNYFSQNISCGASVFTKACYPQIFLHFVSLAKSASSEEVFPVNLQVLHNSYFCEHTYMATSHVTFAREMFYLFSQMVPITCQILKSLSYYFSLSSYQKSIKYLVSCIFLVFLVFAFNNTITNFFFWLNITQKHAGWSLLRKHQPST